MSHQPKTFNDIPVGEHFIPANPSRDFCDDQGRPYVMIKRRDAGPENASRCTTSDTINAIVKKDDSPRTVPGATWVVPVVL